MNSECRRTEGLEDVGKGRVKKRRKEPHRVRKESAVVSNGSQNGT
jgi:hypothetical protein